MIQICPSCGGNKMRFLGNNIYECEFCKQTFQEMQGPDPAMFSGQQQYQQPPRFQQQYQQPYQQQYYNQQKCPVANIGFGDAVSICVKEKYASFEGRATRSEYWYFVLFYYIILIASAALGALIGALFANGDQSSVMGGAYILYSIVGLGLMIPCLSVFVRRLHDIGKSGWWFWLWLVPIVGSIVLFVFTCIGSQKFDNEYGQYVR